MINPEDLRNENEKCTIHTRITFYFEQTNADNYMYSSNEKFKSKDLFGACTDWKKAAEMVANNYN